MALSSYQYRTLKMAGMAITLSVTAYAFILTPMLSSMERNAFAELMKAFAEIGLAGSSAQIQFNLNPTALFGLLAFSFFAIWTGLKLKGFGRFMVTAQLIIIGWVYDWALWHFANQASAPLSQAAVTIVSCACGVMLKALDQRKQARDAEHYELKLRNQELQESRLLLIHNDEMERRLLAADLHDQVLNDLREIMENLNKHIAANQTTDLGVIQNKIDRVMNETREIMDNLCPVILEHFGLSAAIEDCLEKGKQRAGFDIRFVESPLARDFLTSLTEVEQQLLYRLVQESVTNICKHAGASLVRAAIDIDGSDLVITVKDDGKGLGAASNFTQSRGLGYMRLRAGLIGARIRWLPGDNEKGTNVEIRLAAPLSASPKLNASST